MSAIRFLNCEIDLSRKVFKPRAETAFWSKKVLAQIKKHYQDKSRLKVLDMFTGSGCIGIAFLKTLSKYCQRMDFADISKEAGEQTKINLKMNKIPETKYRIYQSNLFEKLEGKKYDIIFANPPYVALERIWQVQKQVLKSEPKKAFFAGKNGMYYIKKFLKEVKNHLKENGMFFLEFDPLQKEEIKRILEKQGFDFDFYKDQFGKYRWLKASTVK